MLLFQVGQCQLVEIIHAPSANDRPLKSEAKPGGALACHPCLPRRRRLLPFVLRPFSDLQNSRLPNRYSGDLWCLVFQHDNLACKRSAKVPFVSEKTRAIFSSVNSRPMWLAVAVFPVGKTPSAGLQSCVIGRPGQSIAQCVLHFPVVQEKTLRGHPSSVDHRSCQNRQGHLNMTIMSRRMRLSQKPIYTWTSCPRQAGLPQPARNRKLACRTWHLSARDKCL